MKIITTWNDAISLKSDFGTYITERFEELYIIYHELDSLALKEFSLSAYGEILIADSIEEIKGMLFEEVHKIELASGILYVGVWLKNNEVCCDVMIPQRMLTTEQIKNMELECFTNA